MSAKQSLVPTKEIAYGRVHRAGPARPVHIPIQSRLEFSPIPRIAMRHSRWRRDIDKDSRVFHLKWFKELFAKIFGERLSGYLSDDLAQEEIAGVVIMKTRAGCEVGRI